MGIFSVRMRVAHPVEEESVDLDGIVDTGALFSQIPPSVARRLGLPSGGRRTFRLADGSSVDRDLVRVRILYNDLEATTVAILGEETAPILWGATTLETLGLKPDPIRQTLEPTTLYLL